MVEATAKLRALAIFDGSIRGEKLQPSQAYLGNLAKSIKEQKDWTQIFPGVAAINVTSDGTGYALSLRITKKEGIPVQLVPEGTPGATVVAIKRVNELDYYNLSLTQIVEKTGLTQPKTLAIMQHLEMRDDAEYHKKIKIGKAGFNRYSQKAIQKIKEELPKIDIDQVWQDYKLSIKQK